MSNLPPELEEIRDANNYGDSEHGRVYRDGFNACHAEMSKTCDSCKGTGEHLCPEVTEPILIPCTKKGCRFIKMVPLADVQPLLKAGKDFDELRKNASYMAPEVFAQQVYPLIRNYTTALESYNAKYAKETGK